MDRLCIPAWMASALLLLLLGGCATRPVNPPVASTDPKAGYRYEVRQQQNNRDDKENLVILAFSGGGTRAAAFSFGVLEFLRRTEVVGPKGNRVRLLDAVDVITGVSGGSFTALAYGLYGDKLFDEYEQRFLKRNVQGEIIARTFSPANWGSLVWTGWGRSELASQLYDEILFNGATFGDLNRGKGPMILASATDITTGSRFVFQQGIFDVICSDLNAMTLSRAAAASSAVPVVLSSITLNNYGGTCNAKLPDWLRLFIDNPDPPRPAARAIRSLKTIEGFGDSVHRPYLHLVDGGVSDNVGMRGVLDALEILEALHEAGLTDASRQRTQDHRLCREFAIHSANQLGRVGESARYLGHSAQIGRRPDRPLLVRGRRAAEGHGITVANVARHPGFGRDEDEQGSGRCGLVAHPGSRDLRDRRVVSQAQGQGGAGLPESAAHIVRVAAGGRRSPARGGGSDHHGFARVPAAAEGCRGHDRARTGGGWFRECRTRVEIAPRITAQVASVFTDVSGRLPQHPFVRVQIGLVAAACSCLETAPIENRDVASAVVNQPSGLQRACRLGDANAADAEHVGEKFLRNMECVGVRAILRHQQPACETRLDNVKARARGSLRELAQLDENVLVDLALQGRAAFEFAAECGGIHLQCGPFPLHHGAYRRDIHAERERNPQHSFVSNQSNFESRRIVDRHDQRNEASGGEEDTVSGSRRVRRAPRQTPASPFRTRQASAAARLEAATRANDFQWACVEAMTPAPSCEAVQGPMDKSGRFGVADSMRG